MVTGPSQDVFQVTDIAGKQAGFLASIHTVSVGFILGLKQKKKTNRRDPLTSEKHASRFQSAEHGQPPPQPRAGPGRAGGADVFA